MTGNPLSFNFLPHRREFLEISIGSRLRHDFAYNSFTPLPKVRLFSPEEARAVGYPGGGLGWFNFQTTEIGVLVFNNRPASIAWQMATGVTIHEHLHWLWSLSPKTVGCENESERFVQNVFTDAANEQRALIESPYARRYLRRLRQLLLPNAWAGDVVEPLYRAGYMTLAVHTLLSVKGGRIMRRLHNSAQPETMAKELWQLCEKAFKNQLPEEQMEVWLKAFSLSLRAWTTDSDFTRFSLAKEFIALFPPPAEKPPDNDLDVGGHIKGDCERSDAPAGSDKNGQPIQGHKPAATGGGAKPGTEQPPTPDSGSPEKGEENSEPLSFDEPAPPEQVDGEDLSQIEEETRELNTPSESIQGATVTRSPRDKVFPADPRRLVREAKAEATALAERLRIVARPRSRAKDTKGRVVSRIIARDPAADKPFRSRSSPQMGFGPTVFVAMAEDTSSSMNERQKAAAARRAGMTVHLACVQEKVAHMIVTSRTLEILAGSGVSPEKGNALIAGMKPGSGGDNYLNNLPVLIDVIRRRPETVKVLLVLTDGKPGSRDIVTKHIDNARQSGIIVIGIGLELNEAEQTGMKEIFGFGPDQTVLATSDGFARVTAEVLSNAVTRGSRASMGSG